MRLLTIPVLLLVLHCAAGAYADESSDKAKARSLFKQAETQYRLGKFKEALASYEAALKAAHHPSIIFNIAQCHRQLGNARKALFSYKLFLSDWNRMKPGRAPPNKAEVDRHIATLKMQVVEIGKAEEEARRRALDEAAKKKAAAEAAEKRKAEAEARAKAEAEAKARAEEEKKLDAVNAQLESGEKKGEAADSDGDGKKQEVKTKKTPARLAVGYARLMGLKVSGAEVSVSGQVMGTTPLTRPLRLSVGRNRIEVYAEKYRPWASEVEIKEGETTDVMVSLKEARRPSRVLLGVSIACFVLAGGSQGVAQVFSASHDKDVREYNVAKGLFDVDPLQWPAPDEVDSKNHDIMVAGHVLTGVFGAAAVGTLIGYFVTLAKASDPAPDPAPVTFAPTLNGAMLKGHF